MQVDRATDSRELRGESKPTIGTVDRLILRVHETSTSAFYDNLNYRKNRRGACLQDFTDKRGGASGGIIPSRRYNVSNSGHIGIWHSGGMWAAWELLHDSGRSQVDMGGIYDRPLKVA